MPAADHPNARVLLPGGVIKFDLADDFAGLIDEIDVDHLGVRWGLMRMATGSVYACRGVREGGKARTLLLHREILRAPPGLQVDHINHNGLDCRRHNLRLATRRQNQANSLKPRGNRTSRYKGVYRHSGSDKWRACIRRRGRTTALGCFDCELDAARAYDEAARHEFGIYAALNFPRLGEVSAFTGKIVPAESGV